MYVSISVTRGRILVSKEKENLHRIWNNVFSKAMLGKEGRRGGKGGLLDGGVNMGRVSGRMSVGVGKTSMTEKCVCAGKGLGR